MRCDPGEWRCDRLRELDRQLEFAQAYERRREGRRHPRTIKRDAEARARRALYLIETGRVEEFRREISGETRVAGG